jgi:hypothetical protein
MVAPGADEAIVLERVPAAEPAGKALVATR